jgi:seryl-tRNA synthetase
LVAQKVLNEKLLKVGNLVHDTVHVDKNEDNNPVVRTWGEKRELAINDTPGFCHHHQILYMLNGYEPKKGTFISLNELFLLIKI